MRNTEVSRLATFIRLEIPLEDLTLGDPYRYASLPLCIIDAVFATGVRREAAENVVRRYCEHFEVPRLRSEAAEQGVASPEATVSGFREDSVSALLGRFDELGIEEMADTVFRNRQRTSTQNGILKAEAVYRFARALREAGVEDFATALAHTDDEALDAQLRQIPGQHVSVGVFWMFAGTESCAKAGPALYQFVSEILGRRVSVTELRGLLTALLAELRTDRPDLTLQLLDLGIRTTQRRMRPAAPQDVRAASSSYEEDRIAEAAPPYPFPEETGRHSVEEYLDLEEVSTFNHEYIAGQVFAMSTPTLRHDLICGNLCFEIGTHLRGKPCKVFSRATKLSFRHAEREIVYCPDIMVACGPLDLEGRYVSEPRLVIEVVSPSTERIDRREKALLYPTIPAIEEYFIVAQRCREVTVMRRDDHWIRHVWSEPDAQIEIRSLGLTLPIESFYADVFGGAQDLPALDGGGAAVAAELSPTPP